MPGIEARPPERTETSSGFLESPNALPVELADMVERLLDLRLQFLRIGFVVRVEIGADRGRDGEAGRHRQAEIGHLGEVGALAAEQIAHARFAFGLAVAERVDPFAGCFALCRLAGDGFARRLGRRLGVLFFSALRAAACGAAFGRAADGFDFAAVFLVFATALAMTANNPRERGSCAPYTTLAGSAQAPSPGCRQLDVKPFQQRRARSDPI